MLLALSGATLLVAWVWLLVASSLAPDAPRQWEELRTVTPALTLLIIAAASLGLRSSPHQLRSGLFLIGLALGFFQALVWIAPLPWAYYLSLVSILAGLLIGAGAALLAGVALSLGLTALHVLTAVPPAATVLPALGLVWAAAWAAFLSSRSLYTALHWAFHSQHRATELLDQLRQRQGELNRTLAALREANERLARTNLELGIARERAEEARAAKEHFVANVSHELRTPLNLVVGFSEMMYLEPESYDGVAWSAELQSDVGELYRASRHLQSLVNDILDLSRIDAARLPTYRELTDLGPVLIEAVETVAPLLRQRGLQYTLELPTELPQLLIDRTRIRQVLLNLLNNAVRFTASGGITIRVARGSDAIEVGVHDTGEGIPSDRLEAIFERFQQSEGGTTRQQGAGLGLALSRQLVGLHGGRIWAESELGRGSTFRFTLPLPSAAVQAPVLRTPQSRRLADGDNAPVIVVDPDPSVADLVRRYLGDRPVLVAPAMPAAEALVEQEHPAAVLLNLPPDAPNDAWMEGPGPCCRRYRVPLILSSLLSASWMQRANNLNGCLSKPVSRESLRQVLQPYCAVPGTVLVIDDNPGFARLMARMLRTLGLAAQVLMAHTAEDALHIARQAQPDVVLLDLLLPDMHGLVLAKALRAEQATRDTPIIAVTATSYAEEALQSADGRYAVTVARGLSPGSVISLLGATLRVLHPAYEASVSTSAST